MPQDNIPSDSKYGLIHRSENSSVAHTEITSNIENFFKNMNLLLVEFQ